MEQTFTTEHGQLTLTAGFGDHDDRFIRVQSDSFRVDDVEMTIDQHVLAHDLVAPGRFINGIDRKDGVEHFKPDSAVASAWRFIRGFAKDHWDELDLGFKSAEADWLTSKIEALDRERDALVIRRRDLRTN